MANLYTKAGETIVRLGFFLLAASSVSSLSTNNSTPAIYYRDADNDTYGSVNNSISASSQPPGYVTNNNDCDDWNGNIHPGAPEICNWQDDDCDGVTDEGCNDYYVDADGDTYGIWELKVHALSRPDGLSEKAGDCKDNDASVHPGAVEICNGKDDNCNGEVDEGCRLYYRDTDKDGYGDAGITVVNNVTPNGYSPVSGDCNDGDAAVYPSATEVCNDKDDDCDGQVDEGCKAYYNDADRDNYGDLNNPIRAMSQPAGYVTDAQDCNDWDAEVHPGATEICDFKDNNCDGRIDEYCTVSYRDADSDGYGVWDDQIRAQGIPSGYSDVGGDCNDSDPTIHPDAPDICNGINDDCDDATDEDCPESSNRNIKAPESKLPMLTPTEFSMSAYPNPSSRLFNLKLHGESGQGPITIRVSDHLGRVVDIKNNLAQDAVIRIGEGYSPGTYFIEAIQGTKRKTIKLIKTTQSAY